MANENLRRVPDRFVVEICERVLVGTFPLPEPDAWLAEVIPQGWNAVMTTGLDQRRVPFRSPTRGRCEIT